MATMGVSAIVDKQKPIMMPPARVPETRHVAETSEVRISPAVDRLIAGSPELRIPPLMDAGRPMPDRVLFAASLGGRLRVKKPFTVTLEKSEGLVIARIDDITEFGYGSAVGEALHDLGKTLSELYFALQNCSDRLSSDLLSVWRKLSEHIEQVR